MLIKLNSRLRRDAEAGASLVETVVAVAIIVLCLTLAGMALAASLQTTNQASDLNKAYQLINKQFAIARQVSYDKLGIVPSEAQQQLSLVQTTLTKPVCDPANQDCTSAATAQDYDVTYNRQIPKYTTVSPGGSQTSQNSAPITWCGASATNPTYNASSQYNGERRVNLTYSNSSKAITGNDANPIDPDGNYTGDPNNTPQYPLYCSWYQYGQSNGDKMFVQRTTNNPVGGVGTIFVLETNITWVDGAAFDGVNSGTTNCFSGTTNCYMAKRVTVTARWVNTNSAGVSQLQSATASFVRSPTVSECIPVYDTNFNPNAQSQGSAATPAPVPVSSSGVSGVSCG